MALAAVLLSGLWLGACASQSNQSAPEGASSSGSDASARPEGLPDSQARPEAASFKIGEVATVDNPWAMEFLPESELLAITRQSGELELHDTADGSVIEVAGVPEVLFEEQGGLADFIVGPDYDGVENKQVFLSFVEAGTGDTAGGVVVTADLEINGSDAELIGLQRIWEQNPKMPGRGHYSLRLATSPDGKYLFVTSGERQAFDPAQDLSGNLGKIVRLRLDGVPASGNPFQDEGKVAKQVWTFGHRNPLGIAFAPDGSLWVSEMGPQGGDELNLIKPGNNYGWPQASNGSHYDGTDIPDHADGDGFEAPKAFWTPSVSPGSLMIYSGDLFPGWKGDAFLGALSGEALVRVVLDGDQDEGEEVWGMGARIRAVEEGPNGAIWVLEDDEDARLLKLTPAG